MSQLWGPATRRYALTLDDGARLSDARLCDACPAALRVEEWLDVAERPVVT